MAMAIFNCLHRKKRSCKAARRSESLFSTQHNEVVFWFIGVGVGAAKNNKQTNIQTYNKRALMLLITDSLSAHFMKYWLMSASNRENLCSREAALEKLLNGNGKLGVECICSTVSLSHTHLYQSLSMSTGQQGSFFSAFFNDMLMLYYQAERARLFAKLKQINVRLITLFGCLWGGACIDSVVQHHSSFQLFIGTGRGGGDSCAHLVVTLGILKETDG